MQDGKGRRCFLLRGGEGLEWLAGSKIIVWESSSIMQVIDNDRTLFGSCLP